METISIEVIPVKEYYVRGEVEKDVDSLYIFTDNWRRTSGNIPLNDGWYANLFYCGKVLCHGNRTQALIRGLDNAFPISTMIDGKGVQIIDDLFDSFKLFLDFEIELIKHASKKYKKLKYNNEMQFGAGQISDMKNSAPKCWEYLNVKLLEIGINNVFEN